MLNATVLSFSVLTNSNEVHSFVASFVALQRQARTNVSIQIEDSEGSAVTSSVMYTKVSRSQSNLDLLSVRLSEMAPFPTCVSSGPECTCRLRRGIVTSENS